MNLCDIKQDCEELLSRFQKTESVRFEVFSKIWREMKFEQIFYGTVKHENREFSRRILDTACTFFLPPFSFQIRVGGLYLLYSLFHCQTASPPEQIRLALKNWEEVKQFEKDATAAQHFDCTFILRQLMFHKAFHFTAMPTKLVFKRKKKAEKEKLCEEFIERPSRPQELLDMELLEELSNVHKLYGNLKTSVLSQSGQADPGINLIRANLVPELRSSVVDFYKWQQQMHGRNEEAEESGEGTSQGECSRRAALLSTIKSKAYGEAAEAPRSRRHRQMAVDLISSQAGPAHSSRHSRTIKPSLKARTNENVHISGDMWKNVAMSTQIKDLSLLEFVPEGKHGSNKVVVKTMDDHQD